MENIPIFAIFRLAASLWRALDGPRVYFNQKEKKKIIPEDVLLEQLGSLSLLPLQGGLHFQEKQGRLRNDLSNSFYFNYYIEESTVGSEAHLPGQRRQRDLISSSEFCER